MKNIVILVLAHIFWLPIFAQNSPDPGPYGAYNPLSAEPYRPPNPEEIPEGYRYIEPLITTVMINVDSTSNPCSALMLTPYGEHDESYVEPVYFGSSNKTAITQNRPVKATNSFKLYPNPAKDCVELHWDWFAQGLDGALSLSIYSLDGKLLYREVEDDYAKNVWLVKTNTLLTGMYLVEIKGADGEVIFTEKLSIVRE